MDLRIIGHFGLARLTTPILGGGPVVRRVVTVVIVQSGLFAVTLLGEVAAEVVYVTPSIIFTSYLLRLYVEETKGKVFRKDLLSPRQYDVRQQ